MPHGWKLSTCPHGYNGFCATCNAPLNKTEDLAKRARTKDYWYAEDGTLMVSDVYASRRATLPEQYAHAFWHAVERAARRQESGLPLPPGLRGIVDHLNKVLP